MLQYDRRASLVVSNAKGGALDMSQLRVTFEVIKGPMLTPNAAMIRVFNLAPATVKRIAQKEFTKVELSAGYVENIATIFKGSILQAVQGRENPTTTYVDLFCRDSDPAYVYATVNKTLAAGYTPDDVYDTVAQGFSPFDVRKGEAQSAFPSRKAQRGKVMYGLAKDHAYVLTSSHDIFFSIQEGQTQVAKHDAAVPDTSKAVVLSPTSGLLGVPELTEGGLYVRALINPKFKVLSLISIDRKLINTASYSLLYSSLGYRPSFDSDGLYKILALTHSGDTRGNQWETQLICTARSGNAPIRSDVGALVGGQ